MTLFVNSEQVFAGMRKAFANQLVMSYIVFSGQLSRFPDEFKDSYQASQAHASQENNKDTTNIGQTQFIGFAHSIIFSLKTGIEFFR